MRRFTLAMTLGLGLGLGFSGCGPTADPAAPATDGVKPGADSVTKNPTDKGMPTDGGPSGVGGQPANELKGMETPAYRNQPGSEGPGGKAKDGGKGATKPADDKKDMPEKAADGDKKDPVTLSDKELKSIKMLPDEADQKLAMAQKICAVGEDEGKPNHLGAMGVPVKEVVKGKTVFLCCEACVEALKKDPDKYLAKIAK